MAKWTITGQMGDVIEKEGYFIVNIAVNKYRPKAGEKNWVKESTIWFNCISDFRPKVEKGNSVVAEGIFIPSKEGTNLPFQLKINHIGVIQK